MASLPTALPHTDVPDPARRFAPAARVLTSVLAPIEKSCLIWMAERMPRQINSDHLTILALVAMIGAGLSFWLARFVPAVGLPLVVGFLAVNWFGDSLDGTLARVRQQQRPRYGFYVDHVVDALGAACLLGGLALSSYMTPWIAAALLIAYFLLCIEVFLATHTIGEFHMSFFKVGPTELRILVSVGALTLLVRSTSTIFGHTFLLFDVGGVIGAVGLVVTFFASAIRNTTLLYRAEPIPR